MTRRKQWGRLGGYLAQTTSIRYRPTLLGGADCHWPSFSLKPWMPRRAESLGFFYLRKGCDETKEPFGGDFIAVWTKLGSDKSGSMTSAILCLADG